MRNVSQKWLKLGHNPLALIGLMIVTSFILLAVFAPWLPLPDPNKTALDQRLLEPLTDGHWLGTDHLGRDILSRCVWGMRISLLLGVIATIISSLIGSFLGIVSGYFAGYIDSLIMRCIDAIMAFPYLLLALMLAATLGPGLFNALLAVAIVNIPFFARAVRGVTVGIRKQPYIETAVLNGLKHRHILLFEVLPNVMPTIIISIAATLGWMVLETAGLSFLGLGVQPPQADLGSMLSEGRQLFIVAPHVVMIPGFLIVILVIGINLFSDGLRDMLDPRMKARFKGGPRLVTTYVGEKLPAYDASKQLHNVLKAADLSVELEINQQSYLVIEGIGFELKKGESLGIVGESGSGKSMTALSILSLLPSPPVKIVSGDVKYCNKSLLGQSFDELRKIRGNRIAYVFQDPVTTLNPLLNAGTQIIETISAHKKTTKKAAFKKAIKLLQDVNIPEPRDNIERYPHELSGGQCQRVGIAMALANEPDVIIADEPTTALDVTTQQEIICLLKQLQKQRGMSLIFISHDLALVSSLSDRIAVMYAGEIVEQGLCADVISRPKHPYTKQLLACVPKFGHSESLKSAIPGTPPQITNYPRGCRFAPRCQWAVDKCRNNRVALETLKDSRLVRCLRVKEISDE